MGSRLRLALRDRREMIRIECWPTALDQDLITQELMFDLWDSKYGLNIQQGLHPYDRILSNPLVYSCDRVCNKAYPGKKEAMRIFL